MNYALGTSSTGMVHAALKSTVKSTRFGTQAVARCSVDGNVRTTTLTRIVESETPPVGGCKRCFPAS